MEFRRLRLLGCLFLLMAMTSSAQAGSPPVTVDDGDVPEKGEHEYNFIGTTELGAEGQRYEGLADLNWGAEVKGVPIQLKVEMPVTLTSEYGGGPSGEVGGIEAGLKVVALNIETRPIGLSFYPQVKFPRFTGGEENTTSGILLAILGREISNWRIDADGAFVFNKYGYGANYGISLMWEATSKWSFLTSWSSDDGQKAIELGAIMSKSPKLNFLFDIGYLYGTDDPEQVRVAFGVQLM